MRKDKYCCLRPNICHPDNISNFNNIGRNYVYGIDTVYNPVHVAEESRIKHYSEIMDYKWALLRDNLLAEPDDILSVLIVVRPLCAGDRTNIEAAYRVQRFYGELNTCTFYLNDKCICPGAPRYCTVQQYQYGDPSYSWGFVHREIADAWLPYQIELRTIIKDIVTSMSREMRDFMLQDKESPVAQLIYSNVLDKVLFESVKTKADRLQET